MLAPSVDGTKGVEQIAPPVDGLPVGSGFQVNLVKSGREVSTIYAQSQRFSISTSGVVGGTGGTVTAWTLDPPL